MVSNVRGSGPYHVVYTAVGKAPVPVCWCSTLEEAREETKRLNGLLPKVSVTPCDYYSVKTEGNNYGFECKPPSDSELPEIPVCRQRGHTRLPVFRQPSTVTKGRNSNS